MVEVRVQGFREKGIRVEGLGLIPGRVQGSAREDLGILGRMSRGAASEFLGTLNPKP